MPSEAGRGERKLPPLAHVCPRCGAREMDHAEYRTHLAMTHNVIVRGACGALALAIRA